MSDILDTTTISAVFASTVASHPHNTFLAVPASTTRGYLPAGLEITYGEAGRRAAELSDAIAVRVERLGLGSEAVRAVP